MELNNTDGDVGDMCNLNGDCSVVDKGDPLDRSHAKNIDDIATPSELKFDEGIVNKLIRQFNYFLLN